MTGRAFDRDPSISVVIPSHNGGRTLGAVLDALLGDRRPVDEIVVVDDASTDETPTIARERGVRLVAGTRIGSAGGSRNRGWDEATGDVVVFLDDDEIPGDGWTEGLRRALREFPGALVGCATRFTSNTPWGWVSHLQFESTVLPRGEPRRVAFLASTCLAVPRDLPLRWQSSYGGEDLLFCIHALEAGYELVFDPRFHTWHDTRRDTLGALHRAHRRAAFGAALCGPMQHEGLHKRIFSRLPVHYFLLARLPLIYRRLAAEPELRSRFRRLLPRLVIAEWALGLEALRYVRRRPTVREQPPQVART